MEDRKVDCQDNAIVVAQDVIYSHCRTFVACRHVSLCQYYCNVALCFMYWFTTINVLNKQYLCKLTLKIMLLKIVVLGAFGAKDFEDSSW